MADKGKSSIIVIIALILIVIGGGIFGYMVIQKERIHSQRLQDDLDLVKAKQQTLEKDLADSRSRISDLESQLKDTAVQIAQLNTSLDTEKAAKSEAFAQIDGLKKDIEQQRKVKSDLETRLSQAQTDVKKMQGQIGVLEIKKTELEKKLKDMEEKSLSGVELGTIVVNPEGAVPGSAVVQPPASAVAKPAPSESVSMAPAVVKAAAPGSGPGGKVLVVNKDYNFVVINMGSKDGVTIGKMFSLYHGEQYLGDIKVEKLHDSMAAAGFVTANIKDKVSEGDTVLAK